MTTSPSALRGVLDRPAASVPVPDQFASASCSSVSPWCLEAGVLGRAVERREDLLQRRVDRGDDDAVLATVLGVVGHRAVGEREVLRVAARRPCEVDGLRVGQTCARVGGLLEALLSSPSPRRTRRRSRSLTPGTGHSIAATENAVSPSRSRRGALVVALVGLRDQVPGIGYRGHRVRARGEAFQVTA